MLTILDSTINIIGRGGALTQMARAQFGFANRHAVLIACFISYEKWMQREPKHPINLT